MFYLIFCFKLIYNRRFIRKLGFYITHYAHTKYLVSDMCRPQRILQQYQQYNSSMLFQLTNLLPGQNSIQIGISHVNCP